jgi:hypothetical protein
MVKIMSNVENSLEQKYDEYIQLLEILCKCFDENGKDVVALSISTAIRVLIHDTSQSVSLLSHLGKKDTRFLSTSNTNARECVHLGLVRRINVGVHDGVGGEAKYWPLCDETYFPSPVGGVMLDYDDWWEHEIVFQSNDSCLTRKDLVLTMANKDGGAHFDKKIQKKYDNFRHSWSGGSTLVGTESGTIRGYDNIPVRPAVRQIAHEILCSLRTKGS